MKLQKKANRWIPENNTLIEMIRHLTALHDQDQRLRAIITVTGTNGADVELTALRAIFKTLLSSTCGLVSRSEARPINLQLKCACT